jgi:hypothetical protein
MNDLGKTISEFEANRTAIDHMAMVLFDIQVSNIFQISTGELPPTVKMPIEKAREIIAEGQKLGYISEDGKIVWNWTESS